MRRHAQEGADMASKVGDEEITEMVRHHHEQLDGSGYPDRLRGTDIPLGARIIAVADTFDAITSSRPYRRACPHKAAIEILRKEAGSQLDPDAVSAFLRYYSGRKALGLLSLLNAIPERLLSWLGGGLQGAAGAPIVKGAAMVSATAVLGGSVVGPATSSERHPETRSAKAAPTSALESVGYHGDVRLQPEVADQAKKRVSRRRTSRRGSAGRPESGSHARIGDRAKLDLPPGRDAGSDRDAKPDSPGDSPPGSPGSGSALGGSRSDQSSDSGSPRSGSANSGSSGSGSGSPDPGSGSFDSGSGSSGSGSGSSGSGSDSSGSGSGSSRSGSSGSGSGSSDSGSGSSGSGSSGSGSSGSGSDSSGSGSSGSGSGGDEPDPPDLD
jgi:HD domain